MKNKIKKIIELHKKILIDEENNIISKNIEFLKIIKNKINKKGKIIIFGNGGSAADAQHFATELMVRLKKNRKAIPAISLSTDTSAITAIGNDFHFKYIFSRQLEALAGKNDIGIAISTSGNSENIIYGLKELKKKNVYSLGIFGNSGGKAKKLVKNSFSIKNNNPSRVQEIHIIFWQILCENIEDILFK